MDFDLSLSTFAPAIEAIGKAGLPVLETGLTAALSGVAGPFGLLVSPALNLVWPAINGALGLAPDTPPAQTAATINADPAAAKQKLAAVQEQHAYLLDTLKAQIAGDFSTLQEVDRTALADDAAQNAMNAEAAKSASFFVYGYRPAIVWGLGFLTIAYGGAPLLGWCIKGSFGHDWGPAPALPWYVWVILAALLGIIAALRSFDKANGTAALPPAAPAKTAPVARRGGR